MAPLNAETTNLSEGVVAEAALPCHELAERRRRLPLAVVDHLAHGERADGKLRPAAPQADFKERAHEARCGLLHVHHVGEERKAVELELADVGLQEDVDLGRRLLHALLDGDGHALDEAPQLLLLLRPHDDVAELRGEGEEAQQLDVAHRRLEVLVVRRDGRVADVVVRRDAAERRALEAPRALVVAHEAVLVEERSGAVEGGREAGEALIHAEQRGMAAATHVCTRSMRRCSSTGSRSAASASTP